MYETNDQGQATVDDLINALGGPANADPNVDDDSNTEGGTDPTEGQVDDPTVTDDSGSAQNDPEGNQTQEGDEGNDAGSQNQQHSQQERQAQAFAQMRVQNRQMQQTLQGLAQLVGIDPNNMSDIHNAVQQRLLEAEAQKQNVPPEVLGRLQMLEKQNNEREAYLGFQKVKDSFNLSDEALQQFADSLIADGINPFETKVDLVNQYVTRNYEALLESARQRGIQEEAERAAKATQQSTQPGAKSGKDKEIPDKINTISDLDKFLDEA